ncbi:hypothetical protein [Chryseobacterium oryctis]|uniref:Uncharacterized protein n=1 Tax=Chryseobacterium oryctis TaxID=2952618 RepID=A0ABT3HMW8_9FLAO|nr:hypothetical protein [Chryseobacterium oryctis]MCW3161050.1 hypothetical protein [Chryseobacterium oryctis]
MKKLFQVLIFAISAFSFAQQVDFLKIRKYRVNYLNEKIQETSGLSIFNDKLYTFNDSGNAPELFELDKTTGEILKTIKINAKNTDWEALANDGSNFYIGDFGNASGKRKDLKVYKVPFQNNEAKNDSIETISFFYPEQTDFSTKELNTNFDGEAMIYLNGKLHIFTKEWASKSTTHYVINPDISENQKAEKIETFKADFIVTDAAYFDGKLYLIGYTKKTEVFLSIFNETEAGVFFNTNPKRYYLGSALSIGQIEGVTVNELGMYISGEKLSSPLGSTKPSLYFIPKDKFGN